MDVFEKVRETTPEIDGAEENITAARARLMTEIQGAPRRATTRSARRSWILTAGLIGAAAAVTTGVVIMSNLTAPVVRVEAIPTAEPSSSARPTPPPAPSPEPLTASTMFAGASRAAGATVAPGPGQYLRVDVVSQNLLNYNAVDGVNDLAVNRMNAECSWVLLGSSSMFVPADPADVWVSTQYADRSIGSTFGECGQAQSEERHGDLQPDTEPYRMPRGPDAWWVASWASDSNDGKYATVLEEMPADADALIAWLQDHGSEPDKMGWILAKMLSYNAGAPELRAAMYAALSRLPGAELIHSDERTATVQYWTDGLESNEPMLDWWRTVTIDRATGYVTEYTERLGSNPVLVPDSVPDMKNTYSISIVDSAP